MENVASWSAGEGVSAEVFIASNFEENGGSKDALQDLEVGKDVLETKERRTVETYIKKMRPIYEQMIVRDFDGNTAGLYDGSSIYIDRSIPQVEDADGSVERTIMQAEEVFRHEHYHLENDHTVPLIVMAQTKGDIAAVIGGVEFTETALIEGLTVKQTGDQFVSEEYLEYEDMIDRAMANAHLTVGNFEEVVNVTKNVAEIDDRQLVPEQIAM